MIPIKKGDTVKVRLMGGYARPEMQDLIPEGKEVVETVWANVVGVDVEQQELTVRLDNHPISQLWKHGEEVTIPVGFVLRKWDATDPRNQSGE